MTVDLKQVLKDINGVPLKDTTSGTAKDVILKDIIVVALLAQFPAERDLSGKDKFARYQLAQKVHAAVADLLLTPVEIATIKLVVGQAYSSLVAGQVWEILS